jgi:hypothetical protein
MNFPNKKIHQEIDAWLAAAQANALSAEERQALDAHLHACPACRKIQQEHQAMSQLLKESLEEKKPAPDFEDRLVAEFRNGRRAEPARQPRWAGIAAALRQALGRRSFQYGGALAGLAALVMVGTFLTQEDPREKAAARMNLQTARAKLEFTGNTKAIQSPIPSDVATADVVLQSAPLPPQQDASAPDVLKLPETTAAPISSIAEHSTSVRNFSSAWWKDAKAKSTDAPVAAADKENAAAASPSPTPATPSAPGKVIRNAQVQFEVEKFDDAVTAITAATQAEGGYVDTKTSARGANGKIAGIVVAKVLPDHLDAFLARIAGIGLLKNQRIEAQDITKAYTDTDARLRNSRQMEQRLLTILQTKSGKVSELLEVERELGRVRSEIEQMQAELKMYDGQLAYATATIALAEKDLSQAAAFVVKESAEVALLSADVEKTFHGATQAVEAAEGRIEESRLARDEAGRSQGTLRFLVAPEKADALLDQIRALGRVARFVKSDRRIAQDGNAPSDTATVKRDLVEIALTLAHDEETRQTVTLHVVAKDVAHRLAEAKAAALAAQGEILSSNLQETTDGGANARLVVRVPADGFALLQEAFRGLGRVAAQQSQRQEASLSPDADRAPVLLDLTLVDQEAPTATVQIAVLAADVEARGADLKKAAATAGGEVKSSTFERTPDDRATARLVFRLPQERAAAFIAQVRAVGKVESFAESRRDQLSEDAASESAAVEIGVVLHDQGAVIADQNGLGATLRKTLGQGAVALTWSLRMIGVALAFLAPWIVLAGIVAGVVFWMRRRKR